MKNLYLSISDVTVFLTHFPRIVILLLEKKFSPQTDLQFVIIGSPDTESTYHKQVEKHSFDANTKIQHMSLQIEGKMTGIRRLGEIAKKLLRKKLS